MNKWKKIAIALSISSFIASPVLYLSTTQAISNITQSVKKEKQKEIFKQVNKDELKSVIKSNDFNNKIKLLAKMKSGQDEIDFNYDQIYENSLAIVNGDLLIEDIQYNMNKLKSFDLQMYNEAVDKINKDINTTIEQENKVKSINNLYKQNKVNSNNSFQELKSKNIRYSKTSSNDNTINTYISLEDYNTIMNLEQKKKVLDEYVDALNGLKISSTTLTAVAWSVAAFYWGAWWLFGTNVIFAVAATTQAGILTWFATESWNTYNYYNNLRIEMINILNSDEFKIWNEILKNQIDAFNETQLKIQGGINLSISLSLLTNFPKWTIKGLNQLISKGINYISRKKIVSKTIEYTAKKATKFLEQSTINKIAISATAWANPISCTITTLDIVLFITASLIDIVFANRL